MTDTDSSIQPNPKICPSCSSSNTHRTHRNDWEKRLSALIKLKAYRCESCRKRFTRRA